MNQMTGKGTLECVEDEEMGISFIYTGDFVDGKMHGGVNCPSPIAMWNDS